MAVWDQFLVSKLWSRQITEAEIQKHPAGALQWSLLNLVI